MIKYSVFLIMRKEKVIRERESVTFIVPYNGGRERERERDNILYLI